MPRRFGINKQSLFDWLNQNDDEINILKHSFENEFIQGNGDSQLTQLFKFLYVNYKLTNYIMKMFVAQTDFRPPIKIKKSPIHGYGVFSTKKILKNDFITFYPCHFLKLPHTTSIFISDFPKSEMSLAYGITNDMYDFVGNPRITDDLSQVGHMINHDTNDNVRFLNIREEDSVQLWIIVAIEDIEKDEELLLNYGEEYEFF